MTNSAPILEMHVMSRTLPTVLGLLALLVSATPHADAANLWGLKQGRADLASATTLAMGPDDILFVGDAKAATVFAIATGDTKGDPASSSIHVHELPQAVAKALGATEAVINDLAVNPRTGTAFLAAEVDGQPAIVKVDGTSAISRVPLESVHFSKAVLGDAPADEVVGEGPRARNRRSDSITDLAFFENKLLVSGLRSALASSTVRELAFPFAEWDDGVAVEIYHAAHGRDEDNAAMRTFVPLMIDGQPTIVGAYVCTPLVKIPVKSLSEAGDRVKGTTVAELGNRNRPLDMVSYEKDGVGYLLLSNSARGVMKIPTAGLENAESLTEPVRGGGTAGQGFETVEAFQGVVQMDRLNETMVLVLVEADGRQDLHAEMLP
jgi:hypothetical protein